MTNTATMTPPSGEAAGAATYEPFDAAYCRDLLKHAVGPLSDYYFRARVIGAEKLPAHGPAVIATNHSGTAFPYDAIVFDFALWRREGLRPEAKCRSVFEKELTLAWWMRPFGVDNLWRRGGGVDMTFDNFERLLQRGDRVIYYPEGVPGIGKGFQHRYQLQRFRTSFVRLAARHDVPIYPVSVVNAEWVMPFHVTFPPLDRVMQRFFHVPFLPLPAGLLAVVFPWMWYLALPAHMTFVIGDPIDVWSVAARRRRGRSRRARSERARPRGAPVPQDDAGAVGPRRWRDTAGGRTTGGRCSPACARRERGRFCAVCCPPGGRSRSSATTATAGGRRRATGCMACCGISICSRSTFRSAGRCSRWRGGCGGRRAATAA